jgi:hypothetical protein
MRGAMRNLDCPHYDICLSRAAKHNKTDWDCSICVHRGARAERTENDMLGYQILLRAIFAPDLYAIYRGGDRQKPARHAKASPVEV